MGTLTIDTIWDRVNTIAASTPFLLTQAIEPFSFDLQPSQQAHQVYRIDAALERVNGYFGPYRQEIWAMTLWMAQKHQRNPQAATRAVLVSLSSLCAALSAEGGTQDYHLLEDDQEADVRLPDDAADYIVGRVTVRVDFDRAL